MKQQRKIETMVKKSWLLDKAGMLFWQKGYHATSMKDIANACNCKPANLYNYFKNKEDILFEVIRNITEEGVSSIRYLEKDEVTSPVEQLRSLVKSHFAFLAGMKQSSILLSDTGIKDLSKEHQKEVIQVRDTYDRILRKVISRGAEEGYFAPANIQVVGNLIASIVVRSSIWYSSKKELSVDEVGDMMFDFIYSGIKKENQNPSTTQTSAKPESAL